MRWVHYSTDYVFDGTAGRPYLEDDPTHPLGAYAVSKLAGELYAQAYLDAPLIVRTSGVFGPGGLKTARGNFIELMLRLAAAPRQQPIRVVEDHVASPTYAPVLAGRSLDLLERNCAGVFHVGGGTPISWFEYARLIFESAGLHPQLQPTNEREYRTAARRPKYSALSNAKRHSPLWENKSCASKIQPLSPGSLVVRDHVSFPAMPPRLHAFLDDLGKCPNKSSWIKRRGIADGLHLLIIRFLSCSTTVMFGLLVHLNRISRFHRSPPRDVAAHRNNPAHTRNLCPHRADSRAQ